MKHLVSEKISEHYRNRGDGFQVLLLLLLLLALMGNTRDLRDPLAELNANTLYVQVEGAVNAPGVYPFDQCVSVKEVMEAAGGLARIANLPDSLGNTALVSGNRVKIQLHEGRALVSYHEMSAFYKVTLGIAVELNTVSEEELMAIPGIGPHRAHAIVVERNKRGGFASVGELLSIKGIGPKLFREIVPHVSI